MQSTSPESDAPDDQVSREADSAPSFRVRGSLACMSCRYDLRDLATTDVCPECSTPVARTLGSLHAAPLASVVRIRSGLRLMCVAIPFGICAFLVQVFIGFMPYLVLNSRVDEQLAWITTALLLVIGPIISLIGVRRIAVGVESIAITPAGERERTSTSARFLGWRSATVSAVAFTAIVAVPVGLSLLARLNEPAYYRYGYTALFHYSMLLLPAIWLARNIIVLTRFLYIARSTRTNGFKSLSWLRVLSISLAVAMWGYLLLNLASTLLNLTFEDSPGFLVIAWWVAVGGVRVLIGVAFVWWLICVASMWRTVARIAKATAARGEPLLIAQGSTPIPS